MDFSRVIAIKQCFRSTALERYGGVCKQESGSRPPPQPFWLSGWGPGCRLDNEGMYFLNWVLVTYLLSLSQPEHQSIRKSKARILLVLCCPYSGLLSFLMKSHWSPKGVKGLNDINEISITAPFTNHVCPTIFHKVMHTKTIWTHCPLISVLSISQSVSPLVSPSQKFSYLQP